MKKIRDIKFGLEYKMAQKIQEVREAFKNQKGITIMEMLTILGVAIILIGATYGVAKPVITEWWSDKVMPYWE